MYRALVAAAALFALAGCNTVAGFGNDISAVGTALTAAAKGSANPAPAQKTTAAKTAAKKTTKPAAKKAAPAPQKVDVVDTAKPFKPGK